MWTTIQSEITVVPPVTAERSPPDSRMTGADSPVIAASLTEAMPSITSPSPGMMSPASTSTKSPARRSSAETALIALALLSDRESFLAFVSYAAAAQGIRLRLAAAFRHRFGEIGEQHGEPQPEDDLEGEAVPARCCTRSRTSRTVVSAVTISSTNITGFLINVAGSSLTKAWPIAGPTIFGSSNVATGIRLRNLVVSIIVAPMNPLRIRCLPASRDARPAGRARARERT